MKLNLILAATCLLVITGCGLEVNPDGISMSGTSGLYDSSSNVSHSTGNAGHQEKTNTKIQKDRSSNPAAKPKAAKSDRRLEFYGMQWTATVEEGDFEEVQKLGVNAVMLNFSGKKEADWNARLASVPDDWSVIAAPIGKLDFQKKNALSLNKNSKAFIRWAAKQKKILAVYATHEAFWNGGPKKGISLSAQRKLYKEIKAVADVKVYGSYSWSAFEIEDDDQHPIEDNFGSGICDYCDTWFYPVDGSKKFNRKRLNELLENVLQHFHKHNDNGEHGKAKLVWILQAFESEEADRGMPNKAQMIELAETAIEFKSSGGHQVDAAFWYTWRHDKEEYQEVLGTQGDEIKSVVKRIGDKYRLIDQD